MSKEDKLQRILEELSEMYPEIEICLMDDPENPNGVTFCSLEYAEALSKAFGSYIDTSQFEEENADLFAAFEDDDDNGGGVLQ